MSLTIIELRGKIKKQYTPNGADIEGRMKMERKLIPLTDKSVIYARPDGWHYHLNRRCPMLQGRDFERLGYRQIKTAEVKKRKLHPCLCCYTNFKPHKNKLLGAVQSYGKEGE